MRSTGSDHLLELVQRALQTILRSLFMTPLRNNALWIGAIVIVLFGAYYPVIFSEYGFTDDYIAITFHKLVGPWDFKTLYTTLGRPICSVFTGYAYAPIDSISELAYLRTISVLSLVLTGAGTFLFLRHCRIAAQPAILAAALLTLNPAAGVYAGWAITFIYPLSILISLLGGWFIIRCLENWRWRWALLGIGCLLVSFFIYQPTALACLVLFVIHYFTPRLEKPDKALLKWSVAIALTAFSMIVYYAIYRAYLPVLEAYDLTTDRGGITTDIVGKLTYFFQDPLWASIIWWAYAAPQWVGGAILVLLLSSLGYIAFAHFQCSTLKSSLSLVGLFFATTLLASAPLLVPHQNNHQIRVFYPLMIVLVSVYPIALSQIAHRIKPALLNSLVLSIIIGLAYLSNHFVSEGIVKPHSREVQTYKTYLKETVTDIPEIAFFKHPFLGPTYLTEIKRFHEYGTYSSWLPWVPYSLINVLLWEQFPDSAKTHSKIEIIQVYPWQIHEFPKDALVLDANYIFKGKNTPPYTAYKRNMLRGLVPDEVENSLFGTTETLNRSWYYSVPFGFLKASDDGSYELLDYGRHKIEETDSPHGNVLMIDDEGKQYITSPSIFPKVYSVTSRANQTLNQSQN